MLLVWKEQQDTKVKHMAALLFKGKSREVQKIRTDARRVGRDEGDHFQAGAQPMGSTNPSAGPESCSGLGGWRREMLQLQRRFPGQAAANVTFQVCPDIRR